MNISDNIIRQTEYKFPRLKDGGYTPTSKEDINYNCIAWALGDDKRWWWPNGIYYWPDNLKLGSNAENFFTCFKKFGYIRCDNPNMEQGYEKLALYVDANNSPTHAARQLSNGNWTSKLGKSVDIEHTLDGLIGPIYGIAKYFFKKTIS